MRVSLPSHSRIYGRFEFASARSESRDEERSEKVSSPFLAVPRYPSIFLSPLSTGGVRNLATLSLSLGSMASIHFDPLVRTGLSEETLLERFCVIHRRVFIPRTFGTLPA